MEQGGTYSLLGINANEIQTMQQAVTTYKTGFDSIIAEIQTGVDTADAFQGSSIAESMKNYLLAIIGEIGKMSAYMSDFSASLAQVSANYEEAAGSINTTIGQDIDNIEGKTIETTTGVSGFTGFAKPSESAPPSAGQGNVEMPY